MIKTFLIIIFMSGCYGPAYAKTPPEVLNPYKAYRAALEKGDKKTAFKKAKEAWRAAESIIGDEKITGDLAANFAAQDTWGHYTYQDYKDRLKAWRRAAELAHFHSNSPAEVELERRFELIEHTFTLTKIRGDGKKIKGGNANEFSQMENALDRLGKRGSTLEGDMEVLRARNAELKRKYKKALASSEKALAIYENANDGIITQYKPMARLYRANALSKVDRDLEALIAYQDLMKSLKDELHPGHTMIRTAFSRWILIRADLEKKGRLVEAKKAGLCHCWPFKYYDERSKPIYRVEPQYYYQNNTLTRVNQTAEAGMLQVEYDLDRTGSPTNIRFLGSPKRALSKPFKEDLRYNYSISFIDDVNRSIK